MCSDLKLGNVLKNISAESSVIEVLVMISSINSQNLPFAGKVNLNFRESIELFLDVVIIPHFFVISTSTRCCLIRQMVG